MCVYMYVFSVTNTDVIVLFVLSMIKLIVGMFSSPINLILFLN